MSGWARRLVSALGLLAVLGGCKPKGDAAPPKPELKLPIVVRAGEDCNGGRPVYVVVRAVDEQGFVEDGYEEIAGLVVTPDETVLAVLLVFPGAAVFEQIVVDELPAMVGVYGLFTVVEGGGWKTLVEQPDAIEVSATANALELSGD